MKRQTCGIVVWLTLLVCATWTLAQPEGERRNANGSVNVERAVAAAERLGDADLAAKLKSENPAEREAAMETLRDKLRERMEQGRQQGQQRPPQFASRFLPATMVTTDKYLLILRGNTLYQLDVDTLLVLKQVELPAPEGQNPRDGQRPREGVRRDGERER